MPEGYIRLSKKKALELTIQLWDWIEKNPLKKKQDWPGWRLNSIRGYAPYCACCFYVDYRDSVNRHGADDRTCPLYSFWLKFQGDTAENACVAKDTPFSRWHEAQKRKDAKDAGKYARLIRLGAMDELQRLDAKTSPSKIALPGPKPKSRTRLDTAI